MSENKTVIQQPASAGEDEISLLDLLIVLAKHKKMILSVTFVVALVAAGYSLRIPNSYTSTTKILPPQQNQSSASAMLSQLGGLAGMAGGSLGIKNPNDLYVAMLKSRNIMERVAKRFDLQKIYGQTTLAETLEVLGVSTNIISGKDGVITVEVSNKDPQLAANLANAYVEELYTLMQTNSFTEASKKRIFIEQQLRQAKDRLTDAELVLDKTPNTSLKYLDAIRNLKYQGALWEILAKQFEMAKLDEAKDFPLIQVLDKAVSPERRSSPKRSMIVISATLGAFFLALIWAFIRESLTRAGQQPEQAKRVEALRNALKWRA